MLIHTNRAHHTNTDTNDTNYQDHNAHDTNNAHTYE